MARASQEAPRRASPGARAAKLLLDSLDEDPEDPEADALRAAELSRRARAVADGSAELIDAEDRFLREALEEDEDAISYYEGARSGLGETFADEVDRLIALTLEFPEMGPRSWIHRPSLASVESWCARFDVEIDDLVSGDTIVVGAIFHCKRRPGYWKDRLRQFR